MQTELDIVVLILLVGFALWGRGRGFIKTCLGFIPLLGGVIAAKAFSPALAKVLYHTALSGHLEEGVASWLGFDTLWTQGADAAIQGLPLPEFMKEALLSNNNPVIYQILGVGDLEHYIASYVAQGCINVVSVAIVFVVAVVVLKLLLRALDLIAKLPVLHFLNHTAGMIAGLVQGVFVVWVIGLFLVFFYTNPAFLSLFETLSRSGIALFFYEHDLLVGMELGIFG